ncbi:molybdate transport system substrate-binding protein [Mucilaginibacter yixingensis]|uniref:Molybdate transport system substrate-binding protein n=1 Tax=Mucilaginibacter yixingensis TaxID=1295612 RepID=A0A2T5JAA6_9SPHI|nr:molybdate ABC transporter substrate-binding protein [Mucilaginibacter yixingensis]PTQ96974.1 molybdate transport system substrate-binding protein [Mucilaginibacter yixingensis]
MKLFIKALIITIVLSAANLVVQAQTIRVAAAANLQAVIKVLQADFKKRTGISVDAVTGSSGNLVAQINNGAPYDVFLSADMEFPQKLKQSGQSVKDPVVYAMGSLVICSKENINLKNWQKLIVTDAVGKIAIANPKIAPYGRAAEESLQKAGLLEQVRAKAVYGESISQVNTYITTGVVTVGFTTQSLVKDPANATKLYWQAISPKTYAPIEQGMVVLKHATDAGNVAAANRFYQYMLSGAAKSILKKYGYIVP